MAVKWASCIFLVNCDLWLAFILWIYGVKVAWRGADQQDEVASSTSLVVSSEVFSLESAFLFSESLVMASLCTLDFFMWSLKLFFLITFVPLINTSEAGFATPFFAFEISVNSEYSRHRLHHIFFTSSPSHSYPKCLNPHFSTVFLLGILITRQSIESIQDLTSVYTCWKVRLWESFSFPLAASNALHRALPVTVS